MTILKTNTLAGPGGTNAITGAVFFGGDTNTGGLTIADNEDLELGSHTSWTIEFWIKLNRAALSDWDVVMGKGSNQGSGEYEWFVEVMAANHLVFLTTTAGEAWDFNQQITPVLSVGEWYHIAIVRNGSGANTLKSYVNGQEYSSHTSQNIYTGNDAFGIGHFAYTNGLNSDVTLSNVRVVKGTSVYTAAFTPPTSKLTVIPNTVLLCCNDSNDVTQEETGKTITSVGNPVATKDVPSVGTDYGTVFEGDITFDSLNYMTLPKGTTTQSNRGRGLRFGGDTPSKTNAVDYIQIQSGGISQDFGDLLTTLTQAHGGSSSTRLVIFGGYNAPANVADIQYITMATTGNSVDSGINIGSDLTSYIHVASNETRAVYGGGTPITNTLEYVTIASLSSSTNFGDLTLGGMFKGAEMSSSTRGVFAGGYYPAQSLHIQYITIGTTGNSTDFGDLLAANSSPGGICSSPIRGIIWNNTNSIHYITIATTGDATEFGEASVDGFNAGATFSSHTRGCAAGGYNQPSPGSGSNASQNWIDSVEIATTGNAQNFGDLTTLISSTGGGSDCHGGLTE